MSMSDSAGISFQTIVAAIDFSDITVKVLDAAKVMASQQNARLLIVHVGPTEAQFVGYGKFIYPDPEERERELLAEEEMLKGHAEAVRMEGVDSTADLIHGEVAPTILRFSREHGADLIVMGTHGHNFLSSVLLGSVAEGVVRKTSIPVLTIPANKDD